MVKISYTKEMLTDITSLMNHKFTKTTVSASLSFLATCHLHIKLGLFALLFAYVFYSQPAFSTPTSITLITPAHEATIRNTQGQVHISWVAHPTPKVIYEIFLDDVLKKTTSHTAMAITDVERGAHTIYLQVKDKNGKVIAVSPTHTIFVHQNSKLFR